MEFELSIKEKLPKLLEKYNIQISTPSEKEILLNKLAFYIHNLTFNVCALISTITSIYDPEKRKVKPKYIEYSLNYVENKCYPQEKRMKGGSYSIDSDYFGVPSAGYSSDTSGVKMGTINFENQVARPELPLHMKGGQNLLIQEFSILMVSDEKKKEKLFSNHSLKKFFQSFDVSIKENSLDVVKKILKMHLNCFMYDLKVKGPLTLKKLEEVVGMARHKIFT